jgi:hypothetical protein
MSQLVPKSTQTPANLEWPEYLSSYEGMVQHFRAQLENLQTTEKGRRFARLSQRIVPQTEFGALFPLPEIGPNESHDEGVDLTAYNNERTAVLYGQAKLYIDRVEALDTILSKFEAFQSKYHTDRGTGQGTLAFTDPSVTFFIITLSDVDSIVRRYEKKQLSSRSFYDRLKQSKRLEIVQGSHVLKILRGAYLKMGELPKTLRVHLTSAPLQKDNVYIGIVSSLELKALYAEFGDALFFENVRDFQDPAKVRERTGRTTPNLEIIKTVTEQPGSLLSRNNGIVFRAEAVDPDGASALVLTNGSIVNGCQSTMCVVLHATEECFVPAKFVQTSNAWDVAKAANYQNSVNDIDLELARHLRPQVVKRAANISGVKIDDAKESAFQIIDAIYDQRAAYQETRLLYIGLFSRLPNNLYASNYTEISSALLSLFYEDDKYGDSLFEMLFALQRACQKGLNDTKETFTNSEYAGMFDRYYRDDSPAYRCFVGILALCGALKVNVAERRAVAADEYARMKKLVEDAAQLLQNDEPRFLRFYRLASKLWMGQMMDAGGDEAEIRQLMNLQSRKADFGLMYKKLCLEDDLAEKMSRD